MNSDADADADAAEQDEEGLAPEEEPDALTELLCACLVALRLPVDAHDGDAAARIRRMIGTLPDGAMGHCRRSRAAAPPTCFDAKRRMPRP